MQNGVLPQGTTQVGDGVSRNPPDRDKVRDECEQKTGLPKTLKEVFEAVSKSSLEGSMLDDADSIMQLRLAFCDWGDFDMRPPYYESIDRRNGQDPSQGHYRRSDSDYPMPSFTNGA